MLMVRVVWQTDETLCCILMTLMTKRKEWRAMYAGKYGEHTLYWLNCLLNEIEGPYALDRFTGTLRNNADVYMAETSSAQDQLVYFTEAS